jgi:uncharacterized membrane protein
VGLNGVAAFAAAVAVVFAVITGLRREVFGPRRRLKAEFGLEALERRMACGEITKEEFEKAKHTLGA